MTRHSEKRLINALISLFLLCVPAFYKLFPVGRENLFLASTVFASYFETKCTIDFKQPIMYVYVVDQPIMIWRFEIYCND